MGKRLLTCLTIITVLFSLNCEQIFALSPEISLDSALVKLAYENIDLLIKSPADDELMVLGETYKINSLVLENIKHICPAEVADASQIADLFGRIREQDSWGFDPGNRLAEEESFKEMIQNPDSIVLVYRPHNKALGYINLAYTLNGDILDIEVKEVVVEKTLEGKKIAKALSLSALKAIEEKFKYTVTKYRISGESANDKIYGERGLATKAGFQKEGNGFRFSLVKEINFSPFAAIQILQSI